MSDETFTVNDAIAAYMELRRKKERIEADMQDALKKLKGTMTMIESWLMEKADNDGVSSFKSSAGTAFLTTVDFAQVTDWDATLEFIMKHNALHMLEKRVSKKAVREYIEEASEVPPGIHYGKKLTINIRKPTGE